MKTIQPTLHDETNHNPSTGADKRAVRHVFKLGLDVDLNTIVTVMPGGVNGHQLAKQLCAKNPKLKVIYASGCSMDAAGTDLVLTEGVDFLAKPFRLRELAQTVRNRLDSN